MKSVYSMIGAVAVVALAAGCSSGGSSGARTSSTPAANGQAGAGSAPDGLSSRTTSIGTVLVDPSGRTVYELVGESAARPSCTSGCLSVWPAVTSNGHQVVVNGHLAYTFAGDKAPGQTSGQDLTDEWGRWLALDPSGDPIGGSGSSGSTAPSAPTSSAKAPGGGGPAF